VGLVVLGLARPSACFKKRAYSIVSSGPGLWSAELDVVWFFIAMKWWFLLVKRHALFTCSWDVHLSIGVGLKKGVLTRNTCLPAWLLWICLHVWFGAALLNQWAAKLLQVGREMFRDNAVIMPSHEFW